MNYSYTETRVSMNHTGAIIIKKKTYTESRQIIRFVCHSVSAGTKTHVH